MEYYTHKTYGGFPETDDMMYKTCFWKYSICFVYDIMGSSCRKIKRLCCM